MKYFEHDTDWIFTFCKVCWDFKKFVFDKPMNDKKNNIQEAKCSSCNSIQNINLDDAKKYYDQLNEENN